MKILLISDVHIHNFTYQYSQEERLNKYLELGDNLYKVFKENNCDEIGILGDLIDRSVTGPTVLLTVKKFLNKFSGIPIKYILGQHDFDSWIASIDHTYLDLFDNMTYMNGVTEEIEGFRVHWSDFSREKSVNVSECDFLLTHFSFGFQEINHKDVKYKIIAGDIHEPRDDWYNSKGTSISPPLQIHPYEPEDGYCVILTLENNSWNLERIKLPRIMKLNKLQRIEKIKEKLDKIITPDLETIIKENGLEEVYNIIDHSNIPLPISFDFQLSSVNIHNFRSIGDATFTFDQENKIIFFRGQNAKGKTSILESIFLGFTGFNPSDYQKLGTTDPCKVEVTFYFENHEYSIIRTIGKTRIIEDGVDKTDTIKSKRAVDNYILEKFPFIKLLSYFYVKTYHNFFECDRVKLFTEVFNLNTYSYLCDQGKISRKKQESHLNNLELQESNVTGKISSIVETFNSTKEKYLTYKDVEEDKLKDYELKVQDITSTFSKIKVLQDDIKTLSQKLSLLPKEDIDYNLEYKRLQSYEDRHTELRNQKLTLQSEKSKLELEQRSNNSEITKLNKNISDYNFQISKFKEHISSSPKCPNCGTIVNSNLDYYKSEITRLEKEIEKDKLKLSNLENKTYDFSDIDNKIISITEELKIPPKYTRELLDKVKTRDSLKSEKIIKETEVSELELRYTQEDYSNYVDLLSRVKTKIELRKTLEELKEKHKLLKEEKEDITSQIEETKELIDKIKIFISKLDMKNPESVPMKILSQITDQLTIPDLDITFKTTSQLKNGNDKLDINCYYHGIPFDACSAGEKCLLSLIILQVICNNLQGVGLVILDESLCTLSEGNYNIATERIRDMSARNILITSHMPGFQGYDRIVELK